MNSSLSPFAAAIALWMGASIFCAIQGRADDGDDEKGPQGIPTTFQSAGTKSELDTRLSRFVALYVPEGQPPTPFLKPGPFNATFEGKIVLDLAGEYTFSAEGRGTLKLLVNGEEVLSAGGDNFRSAKGKTIRLKRENALKVQYDSPAQGDAALRLFWEASDMRRETLHWKVLRHNPGNKELAHGKQRREVRELIAVQRCFKCHAADADAWMKQGGMPELALDAPAFDDIGARINPAWISQWVRYPAHLRPTATMPRVFTGFKFENLQAKADQQARDVAAYLGSLTKHKSADENAAGEEMVQAGVRLFANLGCIACHLPPTVDEFDDEKKRIPLRDVGAKWKPASLRAFLRQPEKNYQWIRMPNFRLNDAEVAGLAAYLLSVEKRKIFVDVKDASAAEGKKLVQSSGCLNCHPLTGEKSTLAAEPFEKFNKESWSIGCVGEVVFAELTAPILTMTEAQRTSINQLGHGMPPSLKRDAATEFAARQMNVLRCNACHKRGEQLDEWSTLEDEQAGLLAALPPIDPNSEPKEFRADQSRPTLTWAGEKLKPEWMTALFAGKLPNKPRPYLRARMPAFPQRAQMLAHGLAFEHGCPPRSPPDAKADAKLADVGKNLAAKTRWNCASCHDVGKTTAVGVFEAPGPNFMYVRERLRPEYFQNWLWNPLRLEPSTKMPTPYFWGQPSQIKDVLDGSPAKQIDALWNFLLLGDRIEPPPP